MEGVSVAGVCVGVDVETGAREGGLDTSCVGLHEVRLVPSVAASVGVLVVDPALGSWVAGTNDGLDVGWRIVLGDAATAGGSLWVGPSAMGMGDGLEVGDGVIASTTSSSSSWHSVVGFSRHSATAVGSSVIAYFRWAII